MSQILIPLWRYPINWAASHMTSGTSVGTIGCKSSMHVRDWPLLRICTSCTRHYAAKICCSCQVERRHKIAIMLSPTQPSILWTLYGSTFSALTLLVGRQERHPACKNRVVGCWCGCLPGARCRLAYGPADATATHCLLLQYNPDWFYLSGTGSPG